MEALLALVALLVGCTVLIQRVNAAHEAKRAGRGPSADARVDEAWESFGADDAPERHAERVEALSHAADIGALGQKSSLVRYAVMAARAGRDDLVGDLADRADALALTCAETRALRALAEVLTNDDDEAVRAALRDAESAAAGCSKCATSLESQLLSQEVAFALEARGEAREESAEAEDEPLRVRVVRAG